MTSVDMTSGQLRSVTPILEDSGLVWWGAQFWSVYIPMEAVEEGAARVQLEQIDIARRIIRRYPDVF